MKKNYLKIIFGDIFICLVAIYLYSPGYLNLRITDESILKAGMSIICVLLLFCAFLKINAPLLGTFGGYKAINVSEASDIEQLTTLLKWCQNNKYLTNTAKTTLNQVNQIVRKKEQLSSILDRKFQKGSLSWEKFYGVVDLAEQSILKNAKIIANRIQTFDEQDYRRIKNAINTGFYKKDDLPDELQEEKFNLYNKNLQEIQGIVALNERILLKMDAFAMELSAMEIDDETANNKKILSEIENLINETQYYR